jgi:3D (Asp-Asp-Asp) domain-containing protein
MKRLTTAAAFALLFVCQALASERSALARVTVYWHGEGSGQQASWNGARLGERHCAVDPKKIPYGSKVVFPDATCVAVDSGPGVVNRKAARSCGRTAAERNAIVIDRFFDSKRKALAWAKAHPHFMTVRILTPGTKQRSSPMNIARSGTTSWEQRPTDFYQRFESSLDAAYVTVGKFILVMSQVQNIGAWTLMFLIGCVLLAAAFHSSVRQLFVE